MSSTPRTVADVLDDLFPAWKTKKKPAWPPDTFAVAASLLKHGGAYAKLVTKWPPNHASVDAWQAAVERVAKKWRQSYLSSRTWPAEIDLLWREVIRRSACPVGEIINDDLFVVLLAEIVTIADQTCAGFGILECAQTRSDFEALDLLFNSNTLCRSIHSSRATVLPKLHNSLSGLTIRSFTHNLALWDRPEVTALWETFEIPSLKSGMNLLLLPWPLVLEPKSFHSTDVTELRMPENFGFFTYDMPSKRINVAHVLRLRNRAISLAGSVDAIVFPELSLSPDDFWRLQNALGDTLLIAGVGEPVPKGGTGKNGVMIGSGSKNEFGVSYQSKHHRWRIDPGQVAAYGLGPSLAEKKSWWEAIEIPPRECTFVNVNGWLTFSVLICEDLARQDPVAELLRSVGPNLVIALLMDGPQMPARWSARYATVLADDPRSSVLTLTSAGMVDLSLAQDPRGPRSIGLWKDADSAVKQILLDKQSEGVVLSLGMKMEKEWAADGRHDSGKTGYLELLGIHQVSAK